MGCEVLAKQNRKAPQGKPIAGHRLFPAIVALWVAALFGLGSLAIHPRLLESLVIAVDFGRIIPAAAPPLGITARILLGLAMAALGAVLGLAIGCRLAQTARIDDPASTIPIEPDDPVIRRARDAHPDAPARRPFSAHDEINTGEASAYEGSVSEPREDKAVLPAALDQPALAGCRRSLALPDHDEIDDLAPLPGGAPLILNIADLASVDPAETKPPVGPSEPAKDAEPATDSAVSEPVAAAEPATTHDIASANLVLLVDRLAQSMERRRMRNAARACSIFEDPAEAEIALPSAPLALPDSPLALPDSMRPVAMDDDHNEQELPSRLPSPPMIRLPSLVPAAELIAEDSDGEQFNEDTVDEPIDEGDGYSSLINLSRLTASRQIVEQVVGEPEPLAEPVVIFPGQAARMATTIAPGLAPLAEGPEPAETISQIDGQPPAFPAKRGTFRRTRTPDQEGATHDPDETERALRTALSSLQRMSGTA